MWKTGGTLLGLLHLLGERARAIFRCIASAAALTPPSHLQMGDPPGRRVIPSRLAESSDEDEHSAGS